MRSFQLFSLVCLLASVAVLPAPADMLYEFKFQQADGRKTLDNTGTAGGEAAGVFARGVAAGAGSAAEGEFTKDTPNPPANPWAYELPSSDGIHAMHLDLPESADKLRLASEGDEMTIALWVKRNANPQRPAGLVGNFVSETGIASDEPNTGWSFGFADGSTNNFQEGQLLFMMGPITRTYPSDRGSIPAEKWTHVAVVYKQDRSTEFYLDGILVGSAAAFPTPAVTNSAEIRVGRNYYTSGPLNGAIDNLQIFDTALSEEKISQLAEQR